jgi:DNA-binding MarR family transcriptional regulator
MSRTDATLIALRRILRATEDYSRSLAQASGLTPVQMRVLVLIARSVPGQMTPGVLAGQMRVAQATVSALIDRLQAKGLVQRARSENDRRHTILSLTPAGHALADRAPDPLQDQFVSRFESLQDWEQAMLVASLERIAHMLNAAEIDAAPVLDAGDLRRFPTAVAPPDP